MARSALDDKSDTGASMSEYFTKERPVKSLLATLILLAGTSAMACPNLNGNYTCYTEKYEVPLRVTSYVDAGVTTIYFGSVTHIADGRWYEYEDYIWPDTLITQRKSECIGGQILKSEENSAVYREGLKIQEVYRNFEVSLKSKGDLLIRSVTSLDGKTEKTSEYGCAIQN